MVGSLCRKIEKGRTDMAVLITAFDKEYPPEKQAEGLAMYQAVLGGHCLRCEYLIFCSDNESFQPPAFTWCARRRVEIVKSMEERQVNP